MAAKFFVIDGPDGTGKSTLVGMLASSLGKEGLRVLITREPGGTPLGKKIRELVLDNRGPDPAPLAEILLYAADRAHHVETVIRPALASGETVLAERYVDSSLAYQGYGLGWDTDIIERINQVATGGLKPDLTIILDPGADGISRALARAANSPKQDATEFGTGGDRIERRGLEFQCRVRQAYLDLAGREPQRYRVIPCGGKSIPELHRTLHQILRDGIILN